MTRSLGAIIVFAPHPDDEVIACGGTIIKRVDAGFEVFIVFSTDGSQSHAAVLGIDVDPTPAQLVPIRQVEATQAANVLGVDADHLVFVGAEDTRLGAGLDRLRAAVDAILARTAGLAQVYLPHETRELNADHSLTGKIVLERLALSGQSPAIFKYVVWDAQVEADFGYANREGGAPTVAAVERPHREDIAAQLPRKFEAFLQHRTQTALFSPSQTRTVVPPSLLETVRSRPYEEFWVAGEA